MTTFIEIASRVEAAVEAYISVRDFVSREEWKKMFKGEMVSAHSSFTRHFDHYRFEIVSYQSRSSAHFAQKWGYLRPAAPHFGSVVNRPGAR